MHVVLRNEAKRDLRIASIFYDCQLDGLGSRFLSYIDEVLEDLETQAGIHSLQRGFHCKSLRRFPFAIYYLVNGSTVDVVAIIDQRRNPRVISNRLRRDRQDGSQDRGNSDAPN